MWNDGSVAKPERQFVPLKAAILTLSDSRTADTDTSGDLIAERLGKAGHQIVKRQILRENVDELKQLLCEWVGDAGIDVIVSTGGTGLTERDITTEAVQEFIEKSIPGFGELFRMLSYEEIGTSAIESRADAGVANGTLIFSLPGSTGACRLGMDRIIIEQLDIRHRPCNLATLLPRIRSEGPPV